VLLRLLIVAVVLAVWAPAAQAALPVPPPPVRRVSDYAGALSSAAREHLEQTLAARERESRTQVVVAIFPTLAGESLEEYSIRLAQAWRIGWTGLDSGAIFLVFLEERKMRIEVGYGLEATLTDAISASILREVVAPRLREGRLAEGISAGLAAIDQAIAGTYPGARTRQPSGGPVQLLLLALLVGAAVTGLSGAAMAMNARARRRIGWTGGRRGWGPPAVSPGRRSAGIVWPWFGGGLGGGGLGGGGFSGGGGGFGGGGASGSW